MNSDFEKKYFCEKCQYGTNRINDMEKHEKTKKHFSFKVNYKKCSLCNKRLELGKFYKGHKKCKECIKNRLLNLELENKRLNKELELLNNKYLKLRKKNMKNKGWNVGFF